MAGTGLRRRARFVAREILGSKLLFEQEFFSVYNYMFDPDQLVFLTSCLAATASVSGTCLEVGCARAATTVFLKKWMHCSGVAKRYVALDTFSGFPAAQADFEIAHRNKPARIRIAFTNNKMAWVDRSLRLAGIDDVELIMGDAAVFDYSTVGPLSFCLLDVDLYIPVAAALPKIYDNLSPGGMIAIDDCMEADSRWDGALQAYTEFATAQGLPVKIVHRKLGIIEKA